MVSPMIHRIEEPSQRGTTKSVRVAYSGPGAIGESGDRMLRRETNA